MLLYCHHIGDSVVMLLYCHHIGDSVVMLLYCHHIGDSGGGSCSSSLGAGTRPIFHRPITQQQSIDMMVKSS